MKISSSYCTLYIPYISLDWKYIIYDRIYNQIAGKLYMKKWIKKKNFFIRHILLDYTSSYGTLCIYTKQREFKSFLSIKNIREFLFPFYQELAQVLFTFFLFFLYKHLVFKNSPKESLISFWKGKKRRKRTVPILIVTVYFLMSLHVYWMKFRV